MLQFSHLLFFNSFSQINIDPESLKPKLPSRKDLRPYPMTCYLEYGGHSGAVMSISIDVSGQWIASGSWFYSYLLGCWWCTQTASSLNVAEWIISLSEVWTWSRLDNCLSTFKSETMYRNQELHGQRYWFGIENLQNQYPAWCSF